MWCIIRRISRSFTTSYDMNEISQNDVVAVRGGGGRYREGVGAQSSTSAVAAGYAANTGLGGRGGAEWQIVARGKADAGGLTRTTTKVRPSVLEERDQP